MDSTSKLSRDQRVPKEVKFGNGQIDSAGADIQTFPSPLFLLTSIARLETSGSLYLSPAK
jgi:hypothetical protein